MERPVEFNAIVEEWLDGLDVRLLEARRGEAKKEVERLEVKIKEAKKKRKKGEL